MLKSPISMTDLRRFLSVAVGEAMRGKRIVMERNGREVAALVGLHDLRRLERLDEEDEFLGVPQGHRSELRFRFKLARPCRVGLDEDITEWWNAQSGNANDPMVAAADVLPAAKLFVTTNPNPSGNVDPGASAKESFKSRYTLIGFELLKNLPGFVVIEGPEGRFREGRVELHGAILVSTGASALGTYFDIIAREARV